jgi:hypothetical protein
MARIALLFMLISAVGFVVVITGGPHGSTAQAATTPGRVAITALSPIAATESSRLIVSGQVANTNTDLDLTELSVRITISAPLPSRTAIDQVAAGSNSFDGFAISASQTKVAGRLRPGAQRDFTIRIPIREIPLPTPGVYVLGVELVGVDPRLGYTVLGTGRTLLPWVPEPTAAPTALGWLWPLSSWPGRTPDGVLLGDSTTRAITEGGRLANLVQVGAAARKDITWIVDPALVQTVKAMSSGYLVAEGSEVVPGTGEQAARRWIDQMREIGERTDLWLLPYADVDAAALERGGLERDIVRAVSSADPVTREAIDTDGEGTVYWAPSGRLDPSTATLLASTGVRAVVLRDDALPALSDPGITPSGIVDLDTQVGRLRALLIDSGLRAAVTAPQRTEAEQLLARQRFLADTAFISLEAPDIQRTVIAGPTGPRWSANPQFLTDLLTAVRRAPWIETVTMTELLRQEPSAVPRLRAPYGDTERARELPASYIERIDIAQDSLALLRQVVDNAIDITEPISAALLRSASAAWRTQEQTGSQLLTIIQDDLDDDAAKVSVVSRGTVTFSGDTGRIPITVANDFDRPVVVGLVVEGNPTARLQAEQLTPLQIEAGRRASLEVPVRIIGGEPLPVSVRLITAEGEEFGAQAQMTLQTTAYSRAALWVSIGAAVLLVLLVIADAVRRARSRPSPSDVT